MNRLQKLSTYLRRGTSVVRARGVRQGTRPQSVTGYLTGQERPDTPLLRQQRQIREQEIIEQQALEDQRGYEEVDAAQQTAFELWREKSFGGYGGTDGVLVEDEPWGRVPDPEEGGQR